DALLTLKLLCEQFNKEQRTRQSARAKIKFPGFHDDLLTLNWLCEPFNKEERTRHSTRSKISSTIGFLVAPFYFLLLASETCHRLHWISYDWTSLLHSPTAKISTESFSGTFVNRMTY
ncbi:unnamed protein product, partial [Allacma fusca]